MPYSPEASDTRERGDSSCTRPGDRIRSRLRAGSGGSLPMMVRAWAVRGRVAAWDVILPAC